MESITSVYLTKNIINNLGSTIHTVLVDIEKTVRENWRGSAEIRNAKEQIEYPDEFPLNHLACYVKRKEDKSIIIANIDVVHRTYNAQSFLNAAVMDRFDKKNIELISQSKSSDPKLNDHQLMEMLGLL